MHLTFGQEVCRVPQNPAWEASEGQAKELQAALLSGRSLQ